MGTLRQKRLARAIVEDLENKEMTSSGQVLQSVGYSKATSTGHVKKILSSEGLNEELKALGFSQDKADSVVASIMVSEKEKAHDRLDAADKIYKRLGSYAAEKSVNTNININSSPVEIDKFKELREEYERKVLEHNAKA